MRQHPRMLLYSLLYMLWHSDSSNLKKLTDMVSGTSRIGTKMNDLTPNMLAYLDLVNDINHLFIGLEDEEPCDICDGDMKLLDKAVKKFKTTVWENQL